MKKAIEIAEAEQIAQAALRDAERVTSTAWKIYNQGCFIAGKIKREIERNMEKSE